MDIRIQFLQIITLIFALPIIRYWRCCRMIRINLHDIKILERGVPEKLSTKHSPEPGPVPFRTAGRVYADETATVLNIFLESLTLLIVVKCLIVGIGKNKEIKIFQILICK